MELTSHTNGVVNITPDELRAYMAAHAEGEYVLIDVRQPEEYQAQHIPGAKLMPLMDLESRVNEVDSSKEQNRIFLCRSGGRSGRAAGFFAQARGLSNVFNVTGGMLGWNGYVLPDFPNVKAFDEQASVADVLRQAINLEKGADRLYAGLLKHFEGSPQYEVIELLSKAEEAHGRAVYGALRKVAQGHLDDFDKLYSELSGDILEGGGSVDRAIEVAKKAAEQGTISLLELSLDLEFQAYDLYRSLAHRTEDEQLRATFLDLAEQEKRHARTLLKAIGKAAA
jgi:sulfur-carrier protein adenylyltransferase/sulfurtransferase